MEGSKSEAVFDSMDANPKLFINTVLNTLDDLVDDAFDYFLQQASSTLKTEDTDRSQDLSEGLEVLRKSIQCTLDRRLSMWEEYCLKCCFEVPEDFSMPNTDEPNDNNSACLDVMCDQGLDAELDSLRNKISAVSKDTAAVNRELRTLEKQSVAEGRFTELITEAMKSYDQTYINQMFQEMAKTACELRTKAGKLKKRRDDNYGIGATEKLKILQGDSFLLDQKNVFVDAKSEDLQKFLAKMKKIQA